MNDRLRLRLGAVTLALLTLAAIVFADLNFQQRSQYATPDDGVTWVDTGSGVMAWHVSPNSPAEHAGIRKNDYIEKIHSAPIHSATDVTKLLLHAGAWTEVKYQIRRDGESFEVPLITAPQDKPLRIENYLRLTALLYLFIGLFIFAKRWNAPRAMHFYVFCLVSFVLYSFHYSGKLNSFDWTVYWGNVVTGLLQPALLVHFALVFPERRRALWTKLLATYSVPLALLMVHIFVATATLDFMPSIRNRQTLDQIELPISARTFCWLRAFFSRAISGRPAESCGSN